MLPISVARELAKELARFDGAGHPHVACVACRVGDTPEAFIAHIRAALADNAPEAVAARVAIAQGNLTIRITETPQVSQPAPFSETGTTTVVPRTDIQVDEGSDKRLAVVNGGVNLQELVNAAEAFVTQEGFGRDAVALPVDEQGPGAIAGGLSRLVRPGQACSQSGGPSAGKPARRWPSPCSSRMA